MQHHADLMQGNATGLRAADSELSGAPLPHPTDQRRRQASSGRHVEGCYLAFTFPGLPSSLSSVWPPCLC